MSVEQVTCPDCGGTGARIVARTPLGVGIGSGHPCPTCEGTGSTPKDGE